MLNKKDNKKTLKDFILDEDAKISKKALILGGLGITVGMLDNIVEATSHSSSACGGSHSSSIGETSHYSAISHSSHSSY